MPSVLAIDTSSEVCSVAVNKGNKVFSIEEHRRFVHAQQLIPIIAKVLKLADIQKPDAIAISAGPGSYTGLRIGFGTAKGLCFAWNVPMIGISSLKALAINIQQDVEGDYYLPVMNSKTGEVYLALYDSNLKIVIPPKASNIEEIEDVISSVEGKIIAAGNGIYKFKNNTYKNHRILFLQKYNAALSLIMQARRDLNENNFISVATYKPLYLKGFGG